LFGFNSNDARIFFCKNSGNDWNVAHSVQSAILQTKGIFIICGAVIPLTNQDIQLIVLYWFSFQSLTQIDNRQDCHIILHKLNSQSSISFHLQDIKSFLRLAFSEKDSVYSL